MALVAMIVRAKYSEGGRPIRTFSIRALAILIVGLAFAGCGSSRTSSVAGRIDPTKTAPQKHTWPTQNEAAALRACKTPIERSGLSSSAKGEIAVLCARITERVKENTEIMYAVCQELAAATASSGSAESKRIYDTCFAGYRKTLK